MASPTPSHGAFSAHPRRFEHESLDMSDSDSVSVHTPKFINSLSEDEEGPSGHGGRDTERRPQSTVRFSQPLARDGHLSTRSAGPALPGQRDGASEAFGGRESPMVPVHTRRWATESHHVDTRSPLGRNSPLTAMSAEDVTMLQDQERRESLSESDGGDGNDRRSSKTLQQKRLRKRSLSPGRMV
jgi:hypothetical protein